LTLARTYGSTLAEGGTMADVEEWSDRIGRVTAGDINSVAKRYLSRNNAVTGYLTPKSPIGVNQ
jgi:zinc protease